MNLHVAVLTQGNSVLYSPGSQMESLTAPPKKKRTRLTPATCQSSMCFGPGCRWQPVSSRPIRHRKVTEWGMFGLQVLNGGIRVWFHGFVFALSISAVHPVVPTDTKACRERTAQTRLRFGTHDGCVAHSARLRGTRSLLPRRGTLLLDVTGKLRFLGGVHDTELTTTVINKVKTNELLDNIITVGVKRFSRSQAPGQRIPRHLVSEQHDVRH